MKSLKNLMSKIVTEYLIKPNQEVERMPLLEKIESNGKKIWHKVHLGCKNKRLINHINTWTSPKDRSGEYEIQGMSIPLFSITDSKPIEKTINMIVFFISGSNSHLFSCRQRAIECAYATKKAIQKQTTKVLLSRFNPFGVINNSDEKNLPMKYDPQPLSQDDITQDYYQCAKLLLKKYENAQMVIMGHSLGGIFSKKVFNKLKNNINFSTRVKLAYSAMSLPGIADAFMYYRPSRMLKNLIPENNKKAVSRIINCINDYGFKCIQRALKKAVELSGWKTDNDSAESGHILQSNLIKDNRDAYIPDQVASVQKESLVNWIFTTEAREDSHNMPPSKMYQVINNRRVSELEKITKLMEYLLNESTKIDSLHLVEE
ncbi:MAG: hypothetical protein VX737_06345 [Pseudomonadota bacterium]|nr:hypothetical protein [Pseudomonadota bacterium]